MLFIGFSGHLQGGLAAKGAEALADIQNNWVFLPQVQIGLGNIPHAVLLGRLRADGWIRGLLQGFPENLHHKLVGAVSILSRCVMDDADLGLEPAQLLQVKGQGRILLKIGPGLIRGFLIHIREGAADRVVPYPAGPDAVQLLMLPGTVFILREVGHLHRQILLSGILCQNTAEEQDLVIRMGGQHQDIRLFAGGLPALNVGRKHPGAESPDKAQGFVPLYGEGHLLRAVLQGDKLVQISVLTEGFAFAVIAQSPGAGNL